MARGRFISNTLGGSKKFSRLTSDTHRLAYVLLVTMTDVEGRVEADPPLLRGYAYTLLGWTDDQVQAALEDMHRVGLIQLYRIGDDQYAQVQDFGKHNKVRKDREADSKIPPPPEPAANAKGAAPGGRREDAGSYPSQVQVEVQEEVEVEGSAEARFHKLATTGTSEQAETARVRSKLTRTAGRNFARLHEDDLPTWSRWTNDQIEEMWDAAQPANWTGNAATKARAHLFEDLLNERRTVPGSGKAREQPHLALIRKYQGVQGVKDGKHFEVVGADINGQLLMTDVAGYLTPAEVEEARQCRPN